MNYLSKYKRPLVLIAAIICVLMFAQAAFVVLAGLGAWLFGSRRASKAEALVRVDEESARTAQALERVSEDEQKATATAVEQRESELDQWLDS